jgi:hypothetical protein
MLFIYLSSIVVAEPIDVTLQFFVRPSFSSNPDYNEETKDASFKMEQSTRINFSGDWDSLSAKVAFNDSRVWGSEGNFINVDYWTALHEGYVQVGSDDLWARFGRQEFSLLDGRLLWPAKWHPAGRAFDGAKFHSDLYNGYVELATIVLSDEGAYQDECQDSTPENEQDDCADFQPITHKSFGDFFILVNAKTSVGSQVSLMPYYILLDQNPNATDVNRDRLIHSPGLRVEGSNKDTFNYSMDAVYQFGRASKEQSHHAWMVATSIDYSIQNNTFSLWYEENTGDGDKEDGVDENFEPFWGKFHGHRGYGDFIGPINSRDIGFGLQYQINPYWSVNTNVHYLQLSNPEGSWYAFNRKVIGTPPIGNGDANIGQEIDFNVITNPIKGLKVNCGYSFVRPIGVAYDVMGGDPNHIAYVWSTFKR